MEQVVCNLCGNDETDIFCRRPSGRLVRCRVCGLTYVNPRPELRDIDAHYNSDMSSRISYYRMSAKADTRTFSEILALIERHVAPGRLLDVGCNIGTFLELGQRHGWRVAGADINRQAAAYCWQRGFEDVVPGSLSEDSFQSESFDAVNLADVIEHLPDPLGLLRLVHRYTSPGGVIVISTPDISSLTGRVFQIKPLEHLYYFSRHTLTELLVRAGFTLLELRRYDRFKSLGALSHSTTFENSAVLKKLFTLTRMLFGEVSVRFPLGENLLAVAQKPA